MTLKLLQASGKPAKEFRRCCRDARMLPCVACRPDKNSLLWFFPLSEGCNGLAVITPQDLLAVSLNVTQITIREIQYIQILIEDMLIKFCIRRIAA